MTEVHSEQEMIAFGERLGRLLLGGELIELVGDVGAGKTMLVRGIARGMGIDEAVQSPSFTISRLYENESGLRLAHYDFYRLEKAGIMSDELADTLGDDKTSVVIEWSNTVKEILPFDRLKISIQSPGESDREISVTAGGEKSQKLMEKLA